MPDETLDLHFPHAGVDKSAPRSKQPARPAAHGLYSRTCHIGKNVRSFTPSQGRRRGGQRAGLSKYLAARPGTDADFVLQDLAVLTGTAFAAPGASVPQLSQMGRIVSLVAVRFGNVYWMAAGGTSWTTATNNTGETPALNYSGLVMSAANNQKLYYADGTNAVFFDPATGSVEPWRATAGQLPVDSRDRRPRLICTYRGRTVQAGLIGDPQMWFMSAVGDPTDYNYGAVAQGTEAVAGTNAPQGASGDAITSLIPYSDDVLIFGGDSSIYLMRGDPAAGGNIDLVTSSIGMAWGQAWCMDPFGTIYFLSNKTGIFTLVPAPGQKPVRISGPIDRLIKEINTGTHGVRMFWDDNQQGVHVFVTPLAEPGLSEHYFYERTAGAWWVDSFGDPNLDPLCGCVLDGNLPRDRVLLLGSWDGYVRAVDQDSGTDDGTAIASEVWIGPLLTKYLDAVTLTELQAVLATDSGVVTWSIHAGRTAEAASESSAVRTGTFTGGGRTNNQRINRTAHAIYIKLTATTPWALETIRVQLETRGLVKRRGR